MYQGIKKDDSVTSILLFIFNVFLTEQGISDIPLKTILKVLVPFQKSETAIRMGLSRGVHNGLLSNFKKGNEVYYGLTGRAIESFNDWWNTIRQFKEKTALQRANWDGTWSMIFIKSKCEDEFIKAMRQLGYGSLTKDLWVSPYDQSVKIFDLAERNSPGLYVFQSKQVNDGRPEDLAEQIWPIRELARSYNQYLGDLGKTTHDFNPNLFKNGEGLPILHLFGLRLLTIIKEDPQLPSQLLPNDWMGMRAAERFFGIRESLLPGAKDYINNALEGN